MSSHGEQEGRFPGELVPEIGRRRRGAFYLVVVGVLGLYAVMMGEMLTFALTGWFEDPGVHHFHELGLFGMIWVAILGLALQLYRPDARRNAVLVSALVMVPLAAMAVATGSAIAMMPILFGALGLVVVALHPSGRSVLSFEGVQPGARPLVGLLVVAALPAALYAADQVALQITMADDHAAFVHYGASATAAVLVLVLGLLAVLRATDRRFAAWAGGFVAAYLGLAGVAYPGQASSPGVLWGSLAILWGVAFVATFEWTVRDSDEGG